jgi:hypothetical protein
MKPRPAILLFTGLVLIGATATLLARLQNNRSLGAPGLRLVAQEVKDDSGRVINTNTVPLPEAVLDYESSVVPITVGEVKALPKDTTYARRLYKSPDKFAMQVGIVLMGTDRTSIHRPEICLPAQGLVTESQEVVRVPMSAPERYDLPVMKMIGKGTLRGSDGENHNVKGVYAYWFVADGKVTASHAERQFSSMSETLRTGRLERWAYVSLYALVPPGMEEKAFERMVQFIQDTVPKFQIAPAKATN